MKVEYFTLVGSYEGGIKMRRKWVRVKNLNYIDKSMWIRHQGPLTASMAACLSHPVPIDAGVTDITKFL